MPLTDDLKTLFLVDQQLRGLESRLDGARNHLSVQQMKLDQLQQQRQELLDQIKHTKASEANMESEANGLEEHIEKFRRQMTTVKTNKEYQTLLVEVNTFKTDKEKIEEQALELMQQIEQMQEQVTQIETKIAAQEKIKQLAEQKLEERRAEVGDQLADLKARRDEAASHISPSHLAVFERLADDTDGEAMAKIVQEDPRRMEYTCGGCYMSIPAEIVNRLVDNDDLVLCTSCKRILYLDQNLKETMGIK